MFSIAKKPLTKIPKKKVPVKIASNINKNGDKDNKENIRPSVVIKPGI